MTKNTKHLSFEEMNIYDINPHNNGSSHHLFYWRHCARTVNDSRDTEDCSCSEKCCFSNKVWWIKTHLLPSWTSFHWAETSSTCCTQILVRMGPTAPVLQRYSFSCLWVLMWPYTVCSCYYEFACNLFVLFFLFRMWRNDKYSGIALLFILCTAVSHLISTYYSMYLSI